VSQPWSDSISDTKLMKNMESVIVV